MATRHLRSSRKANQYELRANRKKILEARTKGEGLYVYRNRSNIATLHLPKPANDGSVWVGPANKNVPGSGEWEGDSYFRCMVPHEAIIVRVIRATDVVEKKPQKKYDEPKVEKSMTEEKLILDQPDQVTEEGTVEHVVPAQPDLLNETPEEDTPQQDHLLNEDPLDGVTIIKD